MKKNNKFKQNFNLINVIMRNSLWANLSTCLYGTSEAVLEKCSGIVSVQYNEIVPRTSSVVRGKDVPTNLGCQLCTIYRSDFITL